MYLETFGLRERPFGVTPDPRSFWVNGVYAEAEAVLRYGVKDRKGFVLLTGEAGTGKTTLLRRLMASLADTAFVFVFNTSLSFDEMLAFMCDELGLTPKDGGRLARIQALNEFLLAQLHAGKTTALLIDEAQNLKDEALEELRLLSNLETSGEKLVQIVLTGQPELEERLAAPNLRQLAQRIAVRSRLVRLDPREVAAYVEERLRLAGCTRTDLFPSATVARIALYSKGIPRLVNVICDNALLIAFATSRPTVTSDVINEVADDLRLRDVATHPASTLPFDGALASVERTAATFELPPAAPAHRDFAWAALVVALVAGACAIGLWTHRDDPRVQRLGIGWLKGEAVANVEPPASVAPAIGAPVAEAAAPRVPAMPPPAESRAAVLVPPAAAPAPAAPMPAAAPAARPAARAAGQPAPWIEHRVERGTTAYAIAAAAYGSWCQLGLDLIAEANPNVEDLDRIAAGQVLRLPSFSAQNLVRHADGVDHLVLGAFVSRASAERLASSVSRRTRSEVRIVARRTSKRTLVHRVEMLLAPEPPVTAARRADLERLLPPRFEAFASGTDERNRCRS